MQIKEARAINKSLSALGDVISALSTNTPQAQKDGTNIKIIFNLFIYKLNIMN